MIPQDYVESRGYDFKEVLSDFTSCLVYKVGDSDGNDLVMKMCATPEAPSQVYREGRALKILQGLEGIPSLKEFNPGENLNIPIRINKTLFHTSFVAKEYIEGDIPGYCSSDIKEQTAIDTLKEIHNEGFAITDMGHNNIVIDEEGIPYFIDLGQAMRKEELKRPEYFEQAQKNDLENLENALTYAPKGHGNILSTHFY